MSRDMLKLRKSLSIEGELWMKFAAEAKNRHLSVSQLICRALRECMRQVDEVNRLKKDA